MKLSDLSMREYLAIEFIPAFMRHSAALGTSEENIADNTIRYGFLYADAFLRAVGRQDARVKHAEDRAEKAETAVSVMLGMNGYDFHAKIALKEIWEFLGVANQTAAMEKLHDWHDELRMHQS
jgi:hypothetical protein